MMGWAVWKKLSTKSCWGGVSNQCSAACNIMVWYDQLIHGSFLILLLVVILRTKEKQLKTCYGGPLSPSSKTLNIILQPTKLLHVKVAVPVFDDCLLYKGKWKYTKESPKKFKKFMKTNRHLGPMNK